MLPTLKTIHLLSVLLVLTTLLQYAYSLASEECQALKKIYSLGNVPYWGYKWPQHLPRDCKGACEWGGIKCNFLKRNIIAL